MKPVIFSVLVIFAVAAAELYSTENDSFDIEALISNTAEFEAFTGCFLDRNSCDAVAADFKKDIPEAFQQACAKCTDAQKHLFNKFLAALKEKRTDDYQVFKAKYDPEAKYFAALEEAVAKF